MLIYKNGDSKEILGFQCDRCNCVTMTDVIPNEHGEFRYICPKCGAHMKELAENKEEVPMTTAYTVANAAKRLNCSTTTIIRGIYDGRFHDCFTEIGYTGRPAWMIPSDQVEGWVTSGGFLSRNRKNDGTRLTRKEVHEALEKAKAEITRMPANYVGSLDDLKQKTFELFQKNAAVGMAANEFTRLHDAQEKITEVDKDGKPVAGRYPWGDNGRRVFDPEVGAYVKVLDLLDPEEKAAAEAARNSEEDEFMKRVVRRVAKAPKCTKPDIPEEKAEPDFTMPEELNERRDGDYDGDIGLSPDIYKLSDEAVKALECQASEINDQEAKKLMLEEFASRPEPVSPVVRTEGGFSITIPAEMIEDMVKKQVRAEFAGSVHQLRAAFDLLNEELKKLEEAIV